MTPKYKVVLYCGDRNWDDPTPIQRSFDKEKPNAIIHGDARGADKMAGREAHLRLIPVHVHPARWHEYGRAAGPIRNEEMLGRLLFFRDQGANVKVVAFHSNLAESKGTKNMVTLAEKAGLEVEVIV